MSNKLSKKTQPSQQKVTVQRAQFYQGIIPSADEMQKYNEIEPGFASRIIALTESEAEHRRKIDKRVINGSIFATILGQVLAFLSVGLVVALCYYAFSIGFADQAKWIAVSVLVGIASVFLYNKRKGN